MAIFLSRRYTHDQNQKVSSTILSLLSHLTLRIRTVRLRSSGRKIGGKQPTAISLWYNSINKDANEDEEWNTKVRNQNEEMAGKPKKEQ